MINTNSTLRIVTTNTLRRIVRRSEGAGLSNLPNELFWKEIDPQGKHVLNVMPMPGEYGFVRTFAMCKLNSRTKPAEVWIDMTPEDWKRLPEEANG